jgi:hypothetical protein
LGEQPSPTRYIEPVTCALGLHGSANRLPDIKGDRREFTADENGHVGMLFQSPVGLRDISFGQRSEGLMPQIDRKSSPTYLLSADAGHLLLWLF